MGDKYLNQTGLAYFWGKLKAIIQALSNRVDVIGARQYVANAGTSGGWSYKKYSNGSFEAWYTGTINTAVSQAFGNIYRSANNLTLALPSWVNTVQNTSLQVLSSQVGAWVYVFSVSPSVGFTYRIVSATSSTSQAFTVHAYLKGTCDVSEYIS